MARFVLEIGVEEMPARFLQGAEDSLRAYFEKALAENGIENTRIKSFSTPDRLALVIEDLPATEPIREEIVTGPPAAVAWQKDGEPGAALLGFAKNNGITIEEIFRQQTNKGEYIACRKKSGGRPIADALGQILPGAIAAIPFGKKMRWGSNRVTFARPLRWLLALLDSDVVTFQYGPLEAGRKTWGHRVHGQGPFEVPSAKAYEDIISKQGSVILDSNERKALIREKGDFLADKVNGKITWNDKLLAEVAGLVEHPEPLLGEFDPAFLEIPEEVLLTSMETHQKSFGVRDISGKLLPYFLTVLNLTPKDTNLVKKGWERVLRARLEDARFFWRADLEQKPEAWLEKLEDVIYIGPLGSMGDKARRLEKLCEWLAWQLVPNELTAREAARAGRLAKADLVSAMVCEFDTLQGIMGGIYARKNGESENISVAISEHYLPSGPESPVPASDLGAIVSIADKADALAGCFGLNKIPTGAADPNGLRRCALGIIRILIKKGWHLDLAELFKKSRELYGEKKWKLSPENATQELLEFLRGRLRNYFINLGYSPQMVEAVLAAGKPDPTDIQARLDAILAFSKKGNFLEASQTLKRIENISRKAENLQERWQESLLVEKEEKALAEALASNLPQVDNLLAQNDYDGAFRILEDLRKPVDEFFDGVLVMSEDKDAQANRLALLNSIASRYGKIASFSLLQL